MTLSVHQPWDPLQVCAVGRSYPPEFYSWIKVPHVRELFEKIARETEEDYQAIINKLQEFDVTVVRPELPAKPFNQYGTIARPPMQPRDNAIMIGNEFYHRYHRHDQNMWSPILNFVKQQGNNTHLLQNSWTNGAMVSRIGKDLYFGSYKAEPYNRMKQYAAEQFPKYRSHVIETFGHTDGTFCPVAPGLIVSLHDIPTYAETFPDWEVVYLPNQSWDAIKPFLSLKEKNHGKWWIPGFEQDQDVIDCVETWLSHWVGYVEETVFDVNMLTINPTNVIVNNYNEKVFEAFDRHGITAHVIPFRHRYFWDGGIHCITLDLARQGEKQDFFPERNCV
jgi:hypothetical protein